MRAGRRVLNVVLSLGLFVVPARVTAHPLDPLTPDEIRAAAQVARMDPRFAGAQFASILLDEPAKADVNAWRPGGVLPRQARLIVMTSASVFDVVADLTAPRIVSAVERKGIEPPVMLSEFDAAKVVLTNQEFRAALAKRGVTDPDKVFCSPMTAGRDCPATAAFLPSTLGDAIGMHHLTRAEDLPVMPTIWHSFKLRPHNFFDRNPAIDLRKESDDR